MPKPRKDRNEIIVGKSYTRDGKSIRRVDSISEDGKKVSFTVTFVKGNKLAGRSYLVGNKATISIMSFRIWARTEVPDGCQDETNNQ